jgi:hypothetical protein
MSYGGTTLTSIGHRLYRQAKSFFRPLPKSSFQVLVFSFQGAEYRVSGVEGKTRVLSVGCRVWTGKGMLLPSTLDPHPSTLVIGRLSLDPRPSSIAPKYNSGPLFTSANFSEVFPAWMCEMKR